MKLHVVDGRYAVARLGPNDPIPAWPRGRFVSVTRTPEELSIVCDDDAVPPDVRAERGWRCFVAEGPIPFETTGVAAAITTAMNTLRNAMLLPHVFVVRADDTGGC